MAFAKSCCANEVNKECTQKKDCEKECCYVSKKLIVNRIEALANFENQKNQNIGFLPLVQISSFFISNQLENNEYENINNPIVIYKNQRVQALYCNFIFYG